MSSGLGTDYWMNICRRPVHEFVFDFFCVFRAHAHQASIKRNLITFSPRDLFVSLQALKAGLKQEHKSQTYFGTKYSEICAM